MSVGIIGEDFHLGGSSRASHLILSKDDAVSVKWFISKVQKIHAVTPVKFVILPGDVFHRDSINGREAAIFKRFLKEMKKLGIEVWYIQGNHDWNGDEPLCDAFDCHHLTKDGHDFDGFLVRGIDFDPDADKMREEIRSAGPCKALVIHSGFNWNLGYESARSLCADDFIGAERVYAGHVHVADVHGIMVSLGALHPCSFEQSTRKVMTVVDLDTNDYRFEVVPSRKVGIVDVRHDVDITDLETTISVFNTLDPEEYYGKALLVRATSEMLPRILEYESQNPDIIFCKGTLSDNVLDPLTPKKGTQNVLLSDAIPLLIAANRPDLREAIAQICAQGGQGASDIARTLAKELKRVYREKLKNDSVVAQEAVSQVVARNGDQDACVPVA